MPAPVVSPATGSLSFGIGQDFIFQPTATNSPTSWTVAAGGLPPGVLFETNSGQIQGNGSVAGVYNFSLTATNADGTSPAVDFVIGIFNVPLTTYEKKATIDLSTLLVTCTDGASANATTSYGSFCKYGDDLIWSLKFLAPNATGTGTTEANPRISMIKFGIRRDDESPLLIQSDPTSYKNGMRLEGGLFYPEHFVHLPVVGENLLSVVMENIGATETIADVLGEFQIDFVAPTNSSGPLVNRVTTKTFKLRIQRDIADSESEG